MKSVFLVYMHFFIIFLVFASVSGVVAFFLVKNKDKVSFCVEGLNQGFRIRDIATLWNVSQVCEIDEPISLFYSLPILVKCMAQVKTRSESNDAPDSERMKLILSKLYDFRKKLENDVDKKKSLDSTISLSAGQRLKVIFPGKGIFNSEIINSGSTLTIAFPTRDGVITIEGKYWIGHTVNVYLWRERDARYVFDTTVISTGVFMGRPCLNLQHTSKLLRTQKRNAIRAKCHITGELYIVRDFEAELNWTDKNPGYRCLIEDISERGALIRVGGKGVPNVHIKLQFYLNSNPVAMIGVVRTVEYDEEANQSRLHFECVRIADEMKNHILSYVYNIIPSGEKEMYQAISEIEKEEESEENPEKEEKTEDTES